MTLHINIIIKYEDSVISFFDSALYFQVVSVLEECVTTSFLFMARLYFIVWIAYLLFIHSWVDGHLSCFHLLAPMNNAAIVILLSHCYNVLLMVRTLKIYHLIKFQVYDTVLLTMVTISRSYSFWRTETLCPLTNIFLFPVPSHP